VRTQKKKKKPHKPKNRKKAIEKLIQGKNKKKREAGAIGYGGKRVKTERREEKHQEKDTRREWRGTTKKLQAPFANTVTSGLTKTRGQLLGKGVRGRLMSKL